MHRFSGVDLRSWSTVLTSVLRAYFQPITIIISAVALIHGQEVSGTDMPVVKLRDLFAPPDIAGRAQQVMQLPLIGVKLCSQVMTLKG